MQPPGISQGQPTKIDSAGPSDQEIKRAFLETQLEVSIDLLEYRVHKDSLIADSLRRLAEAGK